MKVIGLGEGKYICEVDDSEMWDLVGHTEYDEDFEISAGDELDLTRVFKAAKFIRELDNEHIERVLKELRLALTGVEKVKHTVEGLTLFSKLSEKEITNE